MKKYTIEELEMLKVCYESPTNEYSDLSFEEYIKSAEEAGVIRDLLED
jgi:hypothetical protein